MTAHIVLQGLPKLCWEALYDRTHCITSFTQIKLRVAVCPHTLYYKLCPSYVERRCMTAHIVLQGLHKLYWEALYDRTHCITRFVRVVLSGAVCPHTLYYKLCPSYVERRCMSAHIVLQGLSKLCWVALLVTWHQCIIKLTSLIIPQVPNNEHCAILKMLHFTLQFLPYLTLILLLNLISNLLTLPRSMCSTFQCIQNIWRNTTTTTKKRKERKIVPCYNALFNFIFLNASLFQMYVYN